MKLLLASTVVALATLSMASPDVTAQSSTVVEPDRGWNGLAEVLDKITPSAQTEDPPSGQQINSNIERLINQGDVEQAFIEIENREDQLATRAGPGVDVQLMFQKARALALSKQTAEAESLYQEMTVRFPELAEPWNNLAVIYISRGDLDQARLALETAIMNNPKYTAAISNLADLRLLMALKGYEQAAKLGSGLARQRAKEVKSLLQKINQP